MGLWSSPYYLSPSDVPSVVPEETSKEAPYGASLICGLNQPRPCCCPRRHPLPTDKAICATHWDTSSLEGCQAGGCRVHPHGCQLGISRYIRTPHLFPDSLLQLPIVVRLGPCVPVVPEGFPLGQLLTCKAGWLRQGL